MLIIRADMNKHIATGHIMRCLSIADAAKRLGYDVIFAAADSDSVKLVESRGYECHVLNTKWDDMEKDSEAFSLFCQNKRVSESDIILVDSYYVTSKYFEILKSFGPKIWYIDDLHNEDWSVDGIVCYSNYYDEIGYGADYKGKGLWGTDYVPIRKEFGESGKKSISEKVNNVLVLSGGADPYDVIGNVLSRIDIHGYECINAICGVYNERYDSLLETYKEYPQVHIVKSVTNLIDYMKQADIAISASGSTLFELCAVGTPTICYTLADNQVKGGERFGKDGIMIYAGDVRNSGTFENIVKNLKCLSSDYSSRERISRKMQTVVDGQGATRIVKGMFEGEEKNK